MDASGLRVVARLIVWQNRRICGPVKRSNAREPVCRASVASPPTRAVISAHSSAVLVSIQIGLTWRENAPRNCSASGYAASSARDRVAAGGGQVHAAVLLGGSGDRRDLPQVEAACGQTRHQAIERLGPHQRRRHADAPGPDRAARRAACRSAAAPRRTPASSRARRRRTAPSTSMTTAVRLWVLDVESEVERPTR